jgi:hypothetical protein
MNNETQKGRSGDDNNERWDKVNFLEMQMEESKENVKKGLAHVVEVND